MTESETKPKTGRRRIGRTLLIVLAVLIIVIVAAGIYLYDYLNKETEELAQIDAEIAFMSDVAGNWDIMLYSPDGTTANLTADDPNGDQDIFPNFDFGGEWINFYSTRGEENLMPSLVKTDGTGLETYNWIAGAMKAIQDQRFDNDPAWGPGGALRVWSKVKFEVLGAELFLSNGDGSDERQMTTNGAPTDYMAGWSSDGQHVVYINDEGGTMNVYLLDTTTAESLQLTDTEFDDMMPVYSMDGTQILFITGDGEPLEDTHFDFFLMNTDGTDVRPFDMENDTFEGDPTYSPSGEQIAYMSNESGMWQIYVMNADGSGVQQITEDGSNNLFPAWRPIPADEAAETETE